MGATVVVTVAPTCFIGGIEVITIQTLESGGATATSAAHILQQLIDQQGVKPISDLNELSALWPADDDPDELLAFLATERRERKEK